MQDPLQTNSTRISASRAEESVFVWPIPLPQADRTCNQGWGSLACEDHRFPNALPFDHLHGVQPLHILSHLRNNFKDQFPSPILQVHQKPWRCFPGIGIPNPPADDGNRLSWLKTTGLKGSIIGKENIFCLAVVWRCSIISLSSWSLWNTEVRGTPLNIHAHSVMKPLLPSNTQI